MEISVVIPTIPVRWNLFTKAVNSVFRQNIAIKNLVIVVDLPQDKINIDKYENFIKSAQSQYYSLKSEVQIHILAPTHCNSLSASLNTAISFLKARVQYASSHYICFLDDDDYWNADYLKNITETIEKNKQADVIVGNIIRYDYGCPSGKHQLISADQLTPKQFFIGNVRVQGSNLCVRLQTILKTSGFDESLRSCTDRDICLQLLEINAQFAICPHAKAHHSTLHAFPRLSDCHNEAKWKDLDTLLRKWQHKFSSEDIKSAQKRATEVFGKPENEETIVQTILIGVISMYPELLKRLLNSFHYIDTSKFALTVLILPNQASFDSTQDFMNVDIPKLNIKILESTDSEILDIARARRKLQNALFEYSMNFSIEPIVWILDEDLIFDENINIILNSLEEWKRSEIDVVIPQLEGDSPNAATAGMLVQLIDLQQNLLWFDELAEKGLTSELPDRSGINIQTVHKYPNYYYDYASDKISPCNATFWIEPIYIGEEVTEAKQRLLNSLPQIAMGHNFFRPLQAKEIPTQNTLHRGPCTIVLNRECLRVKQPVIEVCGLTIRRSDMIWALANTVFYNHKIVQSSVSVKHSRRLSQAELSIEKSLKEHLGSIVFNALKEFYQIKSKSPFEDVLQKRCEYRKNQIIENFRNIEQLLQRLETRSEQEVKNMCQQLRHYFNNKTLHKILESIQELAKSHKTVIRQYILDTIVISNCILESRYGLFHQYALADTYKGLKLYSKEPIENINPNSTLLVRIHSSCHNSEVMGATDCDCADQLQKSMKTISHNKTGGIIFYLDQEGRGHGYNKKIDIVRYMQKEGADTYTSCAKQKLEKDIRDYTKVANILRGLGFTNIILLTNNPDKTGNLLKMGLKVRPISIGRCYTHENIRYLQSKHNHGHENLIITPEQLNTIFEKGTKDSITFYNKSEVPYGCFSNFAYGYSFYLSGRVWATAEHYYQAQKFILFSEIYNAIHRAETPAEAKSISRMQDHKINQKFWEVYKLCFMYNALYAKFTEHEELKHLLLKTGHSRIVELSQDDAYWCAGEMNTGKNMLGKLLMLLRNDLRIEESPLCAE